MNALAHAMRKEIHEQPQTLAAAISGRIHEHGTAPLLSDFTIDEAAIRNWRQVYFLGCGTAYHAGLFAGNLMERLANLPARAEVSSDFAVRPRPLLDAHTLAVAISQSGETADTLAALRAAAAAGVADRLALVNVPESTMAREATAVLYTRAGSEQAIPSTKAYTAQLAVAVLLAVHVARVRKALSAEDARQLLVGLQQLPQLAAAVIAEEQLWQQLGAALGRHEHVFFTGYGLDYVTALEGQLKLKESSYIHAEACVAGEIRHGPMALVTPGTPVVALATQPETLAAMGNSISGLRSHGANVVALVAAGDEAAVSAAQTVISTPRVHPCLTPLLAVIPLQLIAYYAAVSRGVDVDRPRNLTKSVVDTDA